MPTILNDLFWPKVPEERSLEDIKLLGRRRHFEPNPTATLVGRSQKSRARKGRTYEAVLRALPREGYYKDSVLEAVSPGCEAALSSDRRNEGHMFTLESSRGSYHDVPGSKAK